MVTNNRQLGNVSISPTSFGDTHAVARLLFRDFLLPFEVTSVLILIAIMGAVVLGRKTE
jgi:NADH-quinone oxidoreductase subunit J